MTGVRTVFTSGESGTDRQQAWGKVRECVQGPIVYLWWWLDNYDLPKNSLSGLWLQFVHFTWSHRGWTPSFRSSERSQWPGAIFTILPRVPGVKKQLLGEAAEETLQREHCHHNTVTWALTGLRSIGAAQERGHVALVTGWERSMIVWERMCQSYKGKNMKTWTSPCGSQPSQIVEPTVLPERRLVHGKTAPCLNSVFFN